MSQVETTEHPPREPNGLWASRNEGAGVLEVRSTWRSASLARNLGLAATAIAMLIVGIGSALGPSGSPIRAAVCLIGMWWPVAHLVNRTHVRADASEVSVWQRPIPLIGRRTFELSSAQRFSSTGRDVMLHPTSGESRRCMKAPTDDHARRIAVLLNAHVEQVRAQPKRAKPR